MILWLLLYDLDDQWLYKKYILDGRHMLVKESYERWRRGKILIIEEC